MIIRIYQVLAYILFCVWQRAAPWKYFQLNAPYFNEQRGIFSKLDTDQLIPEAWRLPQSLDIGDYQPPLYPVFVKPEWGQNSHGIFVVETEVELVKRLKQIKKDNNILIYAKSDIPL